jgi:cell pole-organizing protein PopZ
MGWKDQAWKTAAIRNPSFCRGRPAPQSNNARSLEDLVRELLRPLLKAWLDENLPGMVERMVRSEIERVSRGH